MENFDVATTDDTGQKTNSKNKIYIQFNIELLFYKLNQLDQKELIRYYIYFAHLIAQNTIFSKNFIADRNIVTTTFLTHTNSASNLIKNKMPSLKHGYLYHNLSFSE